MPRNAQRSYNIFDKCEVVIIMIFGTITDTEIESVRLGKAKDVEVINPLDCGGDFVVLPDVNGGISDFTLEACSGSKSKGDIMVDVENIFEVNDKEAFVIGFDGHRAIGAFDVKSGRLRAGRGSRDLGESLSDYVIDDTRVWGEIIFFKK